MHFPVKGPRFPARSRTGVAGRLAAAILAALAVALPAAPAPAQRPPAVVGVDAVVREPLRQTLPVIGRLVATQKTDVAARIKGPVASIKVRVGDRLKVGDVIAELVSDSLVDEPGFHFCRRIPGHAAIDRIWLRQTDFRHAVLCRDT